MMENFEQNLFTGFATRDEKMLRENVVSAITTQVYDCILHPLGFYFIRLAEEGKTTIRLHYWPANNSEKGTAITPYHDHVWELCSCILAGTLENVLLQLDPDERGDFQIADINQTGNIDEVVPVASRVRIGVRESQTFSAGEFYEIPPRVFHYTDVLQDNTVITVVQSRIVVEGGPRTLIPIGSKGHMPARDPITGPDRILDEIKQLLNN